ncbi:hypothetical protein [Kitasatospora terrestris]
MGTDEIMTDEQLDEIEERAARATPGPWVPVLETRGATGGGSCLLVDPVGTGVDDEIYWTRFIGQREVRSPDAQLDADLDFVAGAREDVPRLLAEVRRLRAALR